MPPMRYHGPMHYRTASLAAFALLGLVGCASQPVSVGMLAPQPATQTPPAAAPAKVVKSYLSTEAVQRCADDFLGHYKVDGRMVVIPAGANDFERMVTKHIGVGSSAAVTASSQADGKSEEKESLWDFRRALGAKFSPEKCGEIKAFIDVAFSDAKRVNTLVKKQFNRPRPSEADPEHPKQNPSFPSGHATTAGLRYKLLAAVTEASADEEIELFKQGWFMCFERLVVGVHYPSDVAAGFLLGEMIADEVLKEAKEKPDGEVGRALWGAREEWKKVK